MRRWLLIVVAFGGVLGSYACAARKAEQHGPTSAQPGAAPAEPPCTSYLANTSVTIADIRDGVIMSYSTGPNDVPSLRAAIRRFVVQQTRSRSEADLDRTAGPPLTAPGTTQLLPGVRATMSDTPTGADVILTPLPPALRELLREDVRARRCLGPTKG